MSATLASKDSLIAVLNGLLNKRDDITANNGLNYNTTRLSNTIVELRKCGIKIVNKTIKTPNNKRDEIIPKTHLNNTQSIFSYNFTPDRSRLLISAKGAVFIDF